MKLFSLLNSLDTRQKNKLAIFLNSPLYNKREDVKNFFAWWQKEKERAHTPVFYWKKLYPQKSFSATQWHLLTSRLLKLTEDFLAIQELLREPARKKFYVAKACRQLKNEKLFKSTIKDMNLVLEK